MHPNRGRPLADSSTSTTPSFNPKPGLYACALAIPDSIEKAQAEALSGRKESVCGLVPLQSPEASLHPLRKGENTTKTTSVLYFANRKKFSDASSQNRVPSMLLSGSPCLSVFADTLAKLAIASVWSENQKNTKFVHPEDNKLFLNHDNFLGPPLTFGIWSLILPTYRKLWVLRGRSRLDL